MTWPAFALWSTWSIHEVHSLLPDVDRLACPERSPGPPSGRLACLYILWPGWVVGGQAALAESATLGSGERAPEDGGGCLYNVHMSKQDTFEGILLKSTLKRYALSEVSAL